MKNAHFYLNINQASKKENKLFTVKQDNKLIIKHIGTNKEDNGTSIEQHKFDHIFNNTETYLNLNSYIINNVLSNKNKGEDVVSNCFFMLNNVNSDDVFMLNFIKEMYKISLMFLNDKNDVILFKIGCVSLQNEECYNLINKPLKRNYFDEYFMSNNTTIVIKHLSSFDDLKGVIEECKKIREDQIDSKSNDILLYHFSLDFKHIKDIPVDNKSENNLNFLSLQFDFFEFNYDRNLEEIKIYIENLLRKNNLRDKNFILERMLYRNMDKYDDAYFFLNLNNDLNKNSKYIGQIFEYLKIADYFKVLFGRKDITITEDDVTHHNSKICENCYLKNVEIMKTNKFHQELYTEIGYVSKELELIYKNIKILKNIPDVPKKPFVTYKKTTPIYKTITKIKQPIKKSLIKRATTTPILHKIIMKPITKTITKIPPKINNDVLKLESLVNNIQSLFDKTKDNIYSIKNICKLAL